MKAESCGSYPDTLAGPFLPPQAGAKLRKALCCCVARLHGPQMSLSFSFTLPSSFVQSFKEKFVCCFHASLTPSASGTHSLSLVSALPGCFFLPRGQSELPDRLFPVHLPLSWPLRFPLPHILSVFMSLSLCFSLSFSSLIILRHDSV